MMRGSSCTSFGSWDHKRAGSQSTFQKGACPLTTSRPLCRGPCSRGSTGRDEREGAARIARYLSLERMPAHNDQRTSGARYSGVPQNVFVPPSLPDPVTPSCSHGTTCDSECTTPSNRARSRADTCRPTGRASSLSRPASARAATARWPPASRASTEARREGLRCSLLRELRGAVGVRVGSSTKGVGGEGGRVGRRS